MLPFTKNYSVVIAVITSILLLDKRNSMMSDLARIVGVFQDFVPNAKKTESDFKRNARGRSAAIMNKYHSFDEGFWLKEEYDQMQNERMRTSPRI